jgi:hypothetical protein
MPSRFVTPELKPNNNSLSSARFACVNIHPSPASLEAHKAASSLSILVMKEDAAYLDP